MKIDWRWMILVVVVGVLLGGAIFFALTYEPETVEEGSELLEEFAELGTRSITLFFASSDAQGFVQESRMIPASIHKGEEVETVLAELLSGPSGDGIDAFPTGTRLHQAFYDEELRLLYLDFNGALVSGLRPGSASELMVLGSVMRTLAVDFPGIERVQILVDGLEVETLAGHIDLTRPLRTGEWL